MRKSRINVLLRLSLYPVVLVAGVGFTGATVAQDQIPAVTTPAPPGPYAGEQAPAPNPPAMPNEVSEAGMPVPPEPFPQQLAPGQQPGMTLPDTGQIRPSGDGSYRHQPAYVPSYSRGELSREEFMRRQAQRRRAMMGARGMQDRGGRPTGTEDYAPPTGMLPPPMEPAGGMELPPPPPAPPVAMEPAGEMELPPPPPPPPVEMEPPAEGLPQDVRSGTSAGAGMLQPPAYSPYYGYPGGYPRRLPPQGYGGNYGPPPSAYPSPWTPAPPQGTGGGYGASGE